MISISRRRTATRLTLGVGGQALAAALALAAFAAPAEAQDAAQAQNDAARARNDAAQARSEAEQARNEAEQAKIEAAQAKSDAAQAQNDAAEAQNEAIVVTGIRASIANSVAFKRENTSIVEVVSAEDIGKLPDQSIAESLSRLPGLATQRLDGRASVVSVRGLAPDYTTTLLNGRE
ncbi:MAG TPA: TonB-dependent receptor plug domain-containing protein, partial [Sphingomonas sp.]|nr:TonB-dependent receptor plug domain-containing protein [Sphingomonas sp.]